MARCPSCCRHFPTPEDERDDAFSCPYCLYDATEEDEDA